MTLPPETNPWNLLQRITRGVPQPELTALIAECPCHPLIRAGLFLLNGDWERAHKIAQEHPTPEGRHWHALIHRHEPDFENSKYWLHQLGTSPLFEELARTAEALGVGDRVAPGGVWDPYAFTDAFADPAKLEWTRTLDDLEVTTLLKQQMRHRGPGNQEP